MLELQDNLISIDYADVNENYVAIALYINEYGIGQHSGLLICIDGEIKLFHFTSKEVLIEDIDNLDDGSWYYYKKLDIIHPEEVLTFLSHCELIEENSSPKWALIFDGSYFKDGVYFSKSGLKEYTTCVGFCINVITGFLNGSSYFELNDWDATSTDSFRLTYSGYFDQMLKKIESENPEAKDYKKNYLKRITPVEYSISAFIIGLPIRKMDIDPHIDTTNGYISKERGVA